MNEILLTITQALQLVALAPCIFVIAFLLCSARKNGDNVVPILYFLSLANYFIIPLLSIFGSEVENVYVKGMLQLAASTNVAFSFLLVIQFLQGRIPPLKYWLILTIPLIGGSPFIYASTFATEVCLDGQSCYAVESLRTLYNIFGSALIFLMLVLQFSRSSARIAFDDVDRTHKYWLIIALVLLNLVLLIIDLLLVASRVSPDNALFSLTLLRIAFIYLVLTSIFRVFYDLFDIELMGETKSVGRNPELDKQMIERIHALLGRDHIYRQMGLSRESLAKQLNISEQQVSRIVNTYFGKNFNELINEHRIREAKDRLLTEDTQVTVIAFDVGFSSIASFNRVFREMVGSSPTEFRNFHKNSPR